MYSTFNEGKSVVTEGFIRTLKTKIHKHMTAISKNIYLLFFFSIYEKIDALDDFFDKYNNTIHKTIKIKPI